MAKIIVCLFLGLILITNQTFAQVEKQSIQIEETLSHLEKVNQDCVDAGTNSFIDCSKVFYDKIDSILNVVYKQIRRQMSEPQFNKLKKEQIAWLKKRDKFFKQVDVDVKKENAGVEAETALAINRKAYFVEGRIKELLKKMK